MKATFNSTAAVVLAVTAVAAVAVSTGCAVKPSTVTHSPFQPAGQWPCNPMGFGSTLEQCKDWCRKLDATVGAYHNDICCCVPVLDHHHRLAKAATN